MKILLINIRYGYIGGPERYLFNLKRLLENNNHEVIPFSIKYPINEPTVYDKYFASPLSDSDSVYFKDQKTNIKSLIKTIERNFYSKEVEINLSNLIKDTKPDFAIVLLYLRKLSPAVLVALNKNKIPFAVRMSDFGMICPNLNLFRANNICELCKNGNLFNSVRYKCVHDSYAASLVNYLATKYHYSKQYFDLIKHFISPSRFLINKMMEGGYIREKFYHIPTFAYPIEQQNTNKIQNQIVYSGRIEYVKGVHVLLSGINILKRKHHIKLTLKIAGNGDEKYIESLKKYCSEQSLDNVEFLGNLKKNSLQNLLQESTFFVIPSLWYDNLPNAALESLACQTAVIASNHGCFPEFVIENKTGLLFKPGDAEDLSEKMKFLLENPYKCNEMGRDGLEFIKENHSPQKHYEKLMQTIEKIKS